MAIDTANKRSGAIHVRLPFRRNLPFPDGTIDQADRQQAARMYPGILAAEPAVAAPAFWSPTHIAHWRFTHVGNLRSTHGANWRKTREV